MAKLPVSNDFIAQESKGIAFYFFEKLRKVYKDIEFKTSEELGNIYQEYLNHTQKKYSKIKTLLYKNEGKNLYNFYEHVRVANNKHSLIDTTNSNDLFAASSNVILSGTGGIGKSMLVKHLFLDQIAKGTSVPILFELKSVNDLNVDEDSLVDFIYTEVSNHHLELKKEYFIKTLELGRYTIVFDGLDEVVSSKRSWLDKSIKDMVARYYQNRYVISSRPSDGFIGWQSFVEYSIQKLEKNQALSLISKLEYDNKVKRRFSKELEEYLYDTHESFASIPLLLTIMLMTFEAGAAIPTDLTDFYNQAFYTLYQKHDASKSGYKRELKANLNSEEFKTVLAYVGLKTFFANQVDFDVSAISEMIKKYCQSHNFYIDSISFIDDATHHACMLIQEGLHFKFSHRSFQEYFAALGLTQLDDDWQRKILVQWVQANANQISSHQTFVSSLFSIQRDRTFKNLCIPIIKIMDTKYKEFGGIEPIITNTFSRFSFHKDDLTVGVSFNDYFHSYFELQFIIFKAIGEHIENINDRLKVEELERNLVDMVGDMFGLSYDELDDVAKELLKKWIKGWWIGRHQYLVTWAAEFESKNTTKKRSLKNILDEI